MLAYQAVKGSDISNAMKVFTQLLIKMPLQDDIYFLERLFRFLILIFEILIVLQFHTFSSCIGFLHVNIQLLTGVTVIFVNYNFFNKIYSFYSIIYNHLHLIYSGDKSSSSKRVWVFNLKLWNNYLKCCGTIQ